MGRRNYIARGWHGQVVRERRRAYACPCFLCLYEIIFLSINQHGQASSALLQAKKLVHATGGHRDILLKSYYAIPDRLHARK